MLIFRLKRALIVLIAASALTACGDGMPWNPDCSVGECGDERGTAEDRASDPDFDLSERSDVGSLDIGEDVVATGEVTGEYAELTFEGEPGDWFDIAVYSLGLPNPLFGLTQPESEFDLYSPTTDDGLGERAVMISSGGEQRLRIFAGDESEPGFADRWHFVVEIERRQPPEPTVVDIGDELTVDVNDVRGNLYLLRHSELATDLSVSTMETHGSTFMSVRFGDDFQKRKSLTEFGSESLEPGSETPGETLFFADYARSHEPDGYFRIEIAAQMDLESGASVEETHQLGAGEGLAAMNLDHDGVGTFDIEILEDDEVVVDYQHSYTDEFGLFPGVYYVSEDGGDYAVRLKNTSSYHFEDAAWWSGIPDSDSLGSLGIGEQLDHEHDEPIGADETAFLDFEITEPLVADIMGDIVPGPLFQISRSGGDLQESFVFRATRNYGQDSGWLETTVLEAGRYSMIVDGPGRELEDGYDLAIAGVSTPEVYEHVEELELDRGDVVQLRRGGFDEDLVEVSALRDDQLVFGPMPFSADDDDLMIPIPMDGDYEIVVDGPISVEELSIDIWHEVVSAESLGSVAVDDGPQEFDLEHVAPWYDTYKFEVDEPLYFSWKTWDADSGTLPDVRAIELEDGVPEIAESSSTTGRLGGAVDPGHYLIVNHSSLDGRQGRFATYPIPDSVESPDGDVAFGTGPDDELESTVDVSACPEPERVAVDIDVDYAQLSDLYVDIEAPSGQMARLVEGGVYSDRLFGTFPDSLVPEEDLDLLIDDSADGSWTLHLSNDSSNPDDADDAQLNDWTLLLWCGD